MPDAMRVDGAGVAYGAGRSYGDVDLNAGGVLWDMRGLDRFIAFDDQTGVLQVEAGLLIKEIQDLLIPRGWKLAVTPGTQLITVGGAIANDIHGKNHHSDGNFGHHVLGLTLARTDGELIDCGPDLEPELFAATIGGMGLTGVILAATLRLQPVAGPWIDAEDIVFETIEDFFRLSEESDRTWKHSVSWVDCTTDSGRRGIFSRGNPSTEQRPAVRRDLPLGIPITPPLSMVNGLTLRAFNRAYFAMKKLRSGRALVDYRSFFYPLDGIRTWNRMYGPAGFFQYQSVIPREGAVEATKEMMGEIARSGDGSFLGVLKTFGDKPSLGMLSFPQPGVTLALDFPNRGERTERLFRRLDSIVDSVGGRLYAAKDARMSREMFERGYPRLGEFDAYRDPGISSELSRRLTGK
ncbi:FAD-dependent oxidoreductase [uncultured Amnibacterium sp.]|uniref:FAD-binding oxidoreductase n=1 Tax=uncultured Amnibacterium sp. TaxID=1631851 RepID=UPI0035CB27E2